MEQFADNVWLFDGPVVTAALGFQYSTRMAVIRLSDGGLWVWSPVALPDLQASVAALGEVQHIVQPSPLHDTWIKDWQAAYPKACVWGPNFDVVPPGAEISHVIVPNRIADETVFFHHASGTVLICDLLQQMPRDWYAGWRGVVARLDNMTGDVPQMPRKFRMALRPGARDALRTVLGWPTERLVIAHGPPVTQGAGRVLARAFAPLRL
ncbi:DUF4336 domain-containing protein [Tropicibacter alexandrii]|uniref:DUF4336 domain-containing protein n=1 Tax=Tropicibacter alexandrii TaxID=2267683 RepID=UPI000EF50497|nr:DUF4336 domain-containing protein [Tropicibacter alexandrii]